MQKAKWLKLVNNAISTLEELENLRDEFEGEIADKSESWQESDKGQMAGEIVEADIQAAIDELSDLKSKLEDYV